MAQMAINLAPQPTPQTSPQVTSNPDSQVQNDSEASEFSTTFDSALKKQNTKPDKNEENTSDLQQEEVETQPAGLGLPDKNENKPVVTDKTVEQQRLSANKESLTVEIAPFNVKKETVATGSPNNDKTSLPADFSQLMQPREISEAKQQQATTVTSPQNTILAAEIEKLINQSNEQGVVRVKVEHNAPLQQQTGTPNNSPLLPIVDEQQLKTDVNNLTISNIALHSKNSEETDPGLSKVSQMRLDAVNQEKSKTFKTEPSAAGQNLQQSFSEGNTASTQQGTNISNSPATQTIDTSQNGAHSFNQQLAESTATEGAGKTTLNYQQTRVHENNILNQVIQRFSVNPRLETSKITMQLSPAELGELKIDVLVKGDSIKASIVAQNHQAHEAIEKNMLRLRAVLEDQGFSVDNLVVTTSEDNTFNMFQQEFNQQEQATANENKEPGIQFTLPQDEETLIVNTDISDRVNVKI